MISPEIPEASVPVKLGTENSVKAVLTKDDALLIDKSQRNLVTIETQLEEEVAAPVSKGQRLGTVTIKAGEHVLAQIPLVAEKTIPKLTLGQIFLRLLKNLMGS